jgi:hypothetical protein
VRCTIGRAIDLNRAVAALAIALFTKNVTRMRYIARRPVDGKDLVEHHFISQIQLLGRFDHPLRIR